MKKRSLFARAHCRVGAFLLAEFHERVLEPQTCAIDFSIKHESETRVFKNSKEERMRIMEAPGFRSLIISALGGTSS